MLAIPSGTDKYDLPEGMRRDQEKSAPIDECLLFPFPHVRCRHGGAALQVYGKTENRIH
jgi:hypothetical protein